MNVVGEYGENAGFTANAWIVEQVPGYISGMTKSSPSPREDRENLR